MINLTAIYILWLREMKRFFRAKTRVLGSLLMPFFFLVFLGLGFKNISFPGLPGGTDYLYFLVPGIIGMNLLMGSMMAEISVLWDREFGFLKEIMVTPVHRISIVLGRIAGGTTTAILRGLIILVISLFLGFRISTISSLFMTLVFMLLIAFTFIGLGLIFASRMKDMQGFSLIMNFIIFPLFFLSGAFFPLESMPKWIQYLSFVDPLTYGVDGMRSVLIQGSMYSTELNLMILTGFSILMVFLGTYFFQISEKV